MQVYKCVCFRHKYRKVINIVNKNAGRRCVVDRQNKKIKNIREWVLL